MTEFHHNTPPVGGTFVQTREWDLASSEFAGEDEGTIHVLEPGRYLDLNGVHVRGPASRIEIVAYDQYLQSASGSASDFSGSALNDLIGLYDQMAIEVIADQVFVSSSTTISLSARIQHSADGIHWANKSTSPEIQPFPINGVAPTYIPLGYDDGSRPSLAFVRIAVSLTTSPSAGPIWAHVQVKLTLNDVSEVEFATELEAEFKREHEGLPLEYWKSPKKRTNECIKGLTKSTLHDGKVTAAERRRLKKQRVHWVNRCAALGLSRVWANRSARMLEEQQKLADDKANRPPPEPQRNKDGELVIPGHSLFQAC